MMERAPLMDIAIWLELKKNSGQPAVLFLGSRAGSLFGNQRFYDWLEQLSGHSFANLSDTEKFAEAYRVLVRFPRADVHDILVDALKEANRYDIYLAELIKEEFFDLIISTNIDLSLEETLDQAKLRKLHDYHIVWPGETFGEQATRIPRRSVIKVFGDITAREYKITANERRFDHAPALRGFLESVLRRDTLIVGYDPIWDLPLEPAFLGEGSLWYVNDEPPPRNTYLAHTMEERQGRYLIGAQGNSQRFFQLLHLHILKTDLLSHKTLNEVHSKAAGIEAGIEISASPIAQAAPPLTEQTILSTLSEQDNSQKGQRKKVFISYSHKDSKHLARLKIHLAGYIRDDLIDVWDDTKIEAGADWKEEIQKALDETKVAILLVSADFVASDFIAKNELPKLLDAARTRGTRILIVILNHCNFDDTPLHRFQAVNTPSKPLSEMKNSEKEEIWAKIAKIVTKV